jgi:hypothetical protein
MPECIFCKAQGTTYEHVWPDWLAHYVPKTLPQHSSSTVEIYRTRTDSRVKVWAGDPRSRRVPCVCLRCNTGWMSELQQAAKPRLLPLLDGRTSFLRPYDQKILAAWAAMCTMTAEYYDRDLAAVPFEDREHLRLYREAPPKNWRIWIGRYVRGRWAGYWIHHSLPITEDVREPSDTDIPPPNTQTTTFIVGQLYIHTFSSAVDNIVNQQGLSNLSGARGQAGRVLAQIHPPVESFIAWPTEDIWDVTADQIARFIFRRLDMIGRMFGY